jgi:hypothetical protein
LQGACAGVDLWQDFLQLAFEGLGCIGLQNGLDLLATRQTYGFASGTSATAQTFSRRRYGTT